MLNVVPLMVKAYLKREKNDVLRVFESSLRATPSPGRGGHFVAGIGEGIISGFGVLQLLQVGLRRAEPGQDPRHVDARLAHQVEAAQPHGRGDAVHRDHDVPVVFEELFEAAGHRGLGRRGRGRRSGGIRPS